MNDALTYAVAALVIGSCAAASAQQSATARSNRAKSANPATISLKGCVAEASGHYLLNHAIITEPSVASATPPVGNSDDRVYELVGSSVKTHVGHQVEVSGMQVVPATASGAGQPNDRTQDDQRHTAHPIAGTVNVKSVKMLSSTCP